jgi:hypothetical protein
MDLRKKVSLTQKISEYSIRFRLIEIGIGILLFVIAIFNINGVFVSVPPLALQVENTLTTLIQRDFQAITTNYGVIFVILALFGFRWLFFGFKCGLLWFFFLFFNCLLFIVVGEFKDMMPVLLACILIAAITCFFFIRSMLVKSILPLLFLAYSLSAWLLFLKVSNLAWLGLISIFFADAVHMIFVISYQISKNAKDRKTLAGAIAYGTGKTIPVSLLSVILLIIMDGVFYFMKLPMLASGHPVRSTIIYICYALWMPFFTAAILSFCPLENTCEKMQKKSK